MAWVAADRAVKAIEDHGRDGTLDRWRKLFEATRRLVYGTPDPKPGSFRPLTASTRDFQRAVNAATGGDYAWFFDVYFYQAALPELIVERI